MQTFIPASIAATVQGRPAWLNNVARAAFLLVVIKSAVWLGTAWLALRGFDGL